MSYNSLDFKYSWMTQMYIMKISMGAKIFCLLHSFEETVKHTSVHMSQQKPLSRLLVFSSDPVFPPVFWLALCMYIERNLFLFQLQSEKVMAKQMEFLCNQAALERRLSTGCYRQNSEEHSPNGMSLDNADGQGMVAPIAPRHTLLPAQTFDVMQLCQWWCLSQTEPWALNGQDKISLCPEVLTV